MLSLFQCTRLVCALEMLVSLPVIWVADVLTCVSVLTIPLTVSSLSKDIKVSDRQAVIWCRITGGLLRYFRFKYRIVLNNSRLVLRSQLNCPLWHSNQIKKQLHSSVQCPALRHFNTEPLLFLCIENLRCVYLRRPLLTRLCDLLICIYGNVFHLAKFDLITVYTIDILIESKPWND